MEFLGVPSSQSLCDLLFIGEELIQGAWRDPRPSGNTIGVGLVVAHFRKDRFSSSKNGSDALDPSRSSLNRLCVFPLIHTMHQIFVPDSARLLVSLVSLANLLTTRIKTRLCSIAEQDSFVHVNRRGVQMIITTNRYVVQAAYAAQNQEHIRRVMEELRALHRTDLTYSVFVQDDGKTFVHLRFCANEEASKVFDRLPTFQAFAAALLASHPEVPPTSAIHLTLVDSTSDLL